MNASSDAPQNQTPVTPYKFKLGQTIILWFLVGVIFTMIMVNHHPSLVKDMPGIVETGLTVVTAAVISAFFTGCRYVFRSRVPNHGRWLIIGFAGAMVVSMWFIVWPAVVVAWAVAVVLGYLMDKYLPMPEPGSPNPYDQ